jgi:hypothetical protein
VVHAALDQVSSEHLAHYNVHCPHCGKANHVSRIELQRAAPDWKNPENKVNHMIINKGGLPNDHNLTISTN